MSRRFRGVASVGAAFTVAVAGLAVTGLATSGAVIARDGAWRPAGGQPPMITAAPNEDDALRFYEDALRYLAAGDRATARRILEVLVANYPDSASARRARVRLQEIYAADAEAAPRAPAIASMLPGPSRPREPEPARPIPAGTGAADRSAPAPTIEGWRARKHVPATVEQDFAQSTGDRIFFAEGSDELGSRARIVLAAQAHWLLRNPDVPVVIEGHADDPGGEERNSDLSRRRAEAVRARLIEEGVPPARIRMIAYGASRRIADCRTPDCTMHNRRVVTLVGRHAAEAAGAGSHAMRPSR